MKIILPLIIIVTGTSVILAKSVKSVGVTGILKCDGEPVKDGVIELYSQRFSSDPDVLLGKTTTNAQGQFTITGISKKHTFNPQLGVIHSCRSKPCSRKVLLGIPEVYVKPSSVPKDLYNLGSVEMKKKFPTETRICPVKN